MIVRALLRPQPATPATTKRTSVRQDTSPAVAQDTTASARAMARPV